MVGLLSPLDVGKLKLRNRIVLPPMARGLCSTEGEPTQELIEHYSQRAPSLGLLIVEHSYVSKKGKLSEGQLGIHKDSIIPSLQNLSEAINKHNTPSIIQINHAGGKAKKEIIGRTPVAPSSSYFEGKEVRTLKLKDLERIIKDFKAAAQRAIKANFDGVEIHGAHGFLLSQFLSPLTNKRKDKFGGSLENRMRFPLKVVKNVKKVLNDKLLLYRLGATDRTPGGLTIEKSKKFAEKLEKYGVDIIDVSGGLCGSRPEELGGRQGFFIPIAEKIKNVVGVPVIGVGGIKEPSFADKTIRENQVDLVAVGRELLRDPKWAIKAKKALS